MSNRELGITALQSPNELQSKKNEVTKEINGLDAKSSRYRTFAMVFLGLGIIAAIAGIYFYLKNSPLGLGLMSVSPSMVALGGLAFVYASSFKQKQELYNQKLEGIQTQLGLKKELEQQGTRLQTAQNNMSAKLTTELEQQKAAFSQQTNEMQTAQANMVADMKSTQTKLQSDLKTELQTNLANQKTALNEQHNLLQKTQSKFQTAFESELDKQTDFLKSTQTELNGQKTILDKQGKSLENYINETKANFESQKITFKNHSSATEQQQKKINENLESHQLELTNQKNALAEQAEKATEHQKQLQIKLDEQLKSLQANQNAIKEQKEVLDKHFALLEKTQTTISEQKTQIQNLENHIQSMQKDLAGQLTQKFTKLSSTLELTKAELEGHKSELIKHTSSLQNTKEELEGHKDKLVEHNHTWSHQKFDNTFFNFLENHNRIVTEMEIFTARAPKTLLAQGKASFVFLHKKLTKKVAENSEYSLDNVAAAFNSFYGPYKSELDMYFENLFLAIKFVEDSEIKDNNKMRYSNFVRAQLTGHELALIFYYGLSSKSEEHIKGLIEKYGLLKNIDSKLLFGKTHAEAYKKNAFE